MRASVNENCIGCGLCTTLCPEVFSMEYSPMAHAIREDAPDAAEPQALEALESCPVNAIEIED